MEKAAKILGTLENGKIVIESPEEKDAHMDFSVYAEIHEGKSKLAAYIKSQEEVNKENQKLLPILKQSKTSLYGVMEIDRENKIVVLKDLLNDSNIYKVVDNGFSKTATKNILIFTRLIHFDSFSMTSGLIFTFRHDHQEYLIKKSRKLVKRIKVGNDSDKLFIAFFELNRRDGLPIILEDV